MSVAICQDLSWIIDPWLKDMRRQARNLRKAKLRRARR
jgi:hypothetical protein